MIFFFSKNSKPPSDVFQLLLIVRYSGCNENEGNGDTWITDPDGSAGGSYIQQIRPYVHWRSVFKLNGPRIYFVVV